MSIIFFDATQRRRDKMRLRSTQALHEPNAKVSTNGAVPHNTLGAPSPRIVESSPEQPAAASQTAVAIAPPPPPAAPDFDPTQLETFLVNFVVEQTGYPPEIVELDADLEADLGIDSIKKAQLFGELGEYFDLQASTSLRLDDFPTLRHVRDYLAGQLGGSAAPAPAAPPVSEPAPSAAPAGAPVDAEQLETFLVNFVVEQTGYPPEIVELDADLEADLGIDSIKKAQLFGELGEYFDLQASTSLRLDDFPTLRHVRDYLAGQLGGSAAPAPAVPPVSKPAPEPARSAAPAGASVDAVQLETFLVNFVVEQTGYPPEIVELDADLEADLGIDSIKKAQLFGELGEYFDLQASTSLRLDDFPTLRHVRDYLAGELAAR